jgi:hypothetical protein
MLKFIDNGENDSVSNRVAANAESHREESAFPLERRGRRWGGFPGVATRDQM